MDKLPQDVLSHIGTFLKPHDIRACLEAAHVLQPISFSTTSHTIRINQVNAIHTCYRLSRIIRYVRTIKPNLQNITITFFELRHDTMVHIDPLSLLDDIDVHIVIYTCGVSVFRSLLTQLPSCAGLKLSMYIDWMIDDKDLSLLARFPDGTVHCISTFLDHRTYHTLHHPILTRTHTLYLKLLDDDMIDLSSIDITYNKVLDITCHSSDIQCICPYKITCIRDDTRLGFNASRFYTSCKTDPKMNTHSRMQDVYIAHNTKSPHCIWIKLARLLPPYVTYHITPRDSEIFYFMNTLTTNTKGLCRFKYTVYNMESYYAALMCRKLATTFQVGKHEIEYLDNYVPFVHESALTTVHDIYANMHTALRPKWFLFTRLA
jgi:hypothetical protein